MYVPLSCVWRGKDLNLRYDSSSRILEDAAGNIIDDVYIIKRNHLGLITCKMIIYKKLSAAGRTYVKLDKPDTLTYRIHNVNCELIKDSVYTVFVKVIGQRDSLNIKWE
jgi:hypothetical protein